MIYYDYDLTGDYQSTERCQSFITAFKTVFAEYDSVPDLTTEWRCLVPFNSNGTTRYMGPCLREHYTVGRTIITHPSTGNTTSSFASCITELTGEINQYAHLWGQLCSVENAIPSGTVNDHSTFPYKYLRFYNFDNGKFWLMNWSEEQSDRDNDIFTHGYTGIAFLANSDNVIFPTFFDPFSMQCYPFNIPSTRSYGSGVSRYDFEHALPGDYNSDFKAYPNPKITYNGGMYITNAEYNFILPLQYAESSSYDSFKNEYNHFVSSELKILFCDGSMNIAQGNKYIINRITYKPVKGYTKTYSTTDDVIKLRNDILMMPVGTKGN